MDKSVSTMPRLSACALGAAFGVITALGTLIIGILAMHFKIGHAWVTLLGSVYIGYAATFKGVIVGTLWGFVDGYICGTVIAWVYNYVVIHCKCRRCHIEEVK